MNFENRPPDDSTPDGTPPEESTPEENPLEFTLKRPEPDADEEQFEAPAEPEADQPIGLDDLAPPPPTIEEELGQVEEPLPPQPEPEAPQPKRERISSLDAFRGFTILGMVFVIAIAAGQYQTGPMPQTMRWLGSPKVSTWFHAEVGWDLWCEEQMDAIYESGAITEVAFNALPPAEQRAFETEHLGEQDNWPRRHIGVTFTDLIAPWFVFIVGVCIPLSRRKRGAKFWWHAISRTVMLILAGMLYISFVLRQLAPWWGVLQAIGIAYFCGVVLTLFPSKARWVIIGVISLAFLLLTEFWPLWTMNPYWYPDAQGFWCDIQRPFWTLANPMGSEKRLMLIHCLPWLSISYGVMTMIGVMLGEVMRNGHRAVTNRALLLSAIFIPLGLVIHFAGIWFENWSLCMNKPEVTISYAFFTAGLGALVYLGFYWVMDVVKFRFWAKPLNVFGVNPLLAYFMMILMRRWIMDPLGLTAAFNPVRDAKTGEIINDFVYNWAQYFETTWNVNPALVENFFRKTGYHGVMWGLIWTFFLWLIVAYCNRKKIFWKL